MSWLNILKYIVQGNQTSFFFTFVLNLVTAGFITAANPILLKYLFDEGIIRGDFRLFIILALTSILIFAVWRVLFYKSSLSIQNLKVVILKQFCQRLLNQYFDMPLGEVIKKDNGYFVARIYDEAAATVHPTIDCFLLLTNNLVTLAISMAIVISMSWRASATIFFALPFFYLVSNNYGAKIKNLSKVEKEKEAQLKGVLTRSVNSHKLTNIFNLRLTTLKKVEEYLDDYFFVFTERFKSTVKYEAVNGTLMSYAQTLAIIASGYEIIVGRLTFGGYMAFMAAYMGVILSTKSLFNVFPEMSRLSGMVERIKEFDQTRYPPVQISTADFVQLSKVGFKFDEKTIFENINFTTSDSKKILIVGPNGSGKSTLSHIISGLFMPSSGDVTTLPLSRISAVIYPFEFIPGSIGDNFSFVGNEVERERFQRLCRKFDFDGYLDRDPAELSAGERKKLEIMIGLVKESDIYIFDEPLSGIDISKKDDIMNEIFSNTKEKTLIVIMHGDEKYHSYFDKKLEFGKASDLTTSNGAN